MAVVVVVVVAVEGTTTVVVDAAAATLTCLVEAVVDTPLAVASSTPDPLLDPQWEISTADTT